MTAIARSRTLPRIANSLNSFHIHGSFQSCCCVAHCTRNQRHALSQQGPLLQSLRGTSDKAGVALESAVTTLRSMQSLLAPDAPLAVELATTLRELAAASHSVRLLADTLDRNPSAIVRGTEVQAKK